MRTFPLANQTREAQQLPVRLFAALYVTTCFAELLCGVYMHLGKPSAQSNKNKTIQGNVKPGMVAICVRAALFSILQAHIFACC